MTTKQRIEADLKTAMKGGDRVRTACLRMIKSKLLEREVALRGERGKDAELTDDEATQVIAAYAKQRKDSIESYRGAGRDDLASKEEVELAIVQEYLPQQLTEDEVRNLVREAIAESGATSPKDMGLVMKAVMPKVRGRADGKLVNQAVRELLQ